MGNASPQASQNKYQNYQAKTGAKTSKLCSKTTEKINPNDYKGRLNLPGRPDKSEQKTKEEKCLSMNSAGDRRKQQLVISPDIQPLIGCLILKFNKNYTGTASLFYINSDDECAYLLTCAHNVIDIDPFAKQRVFANVIIFQRRVITNDENGDTESIHDIVINNVTPRNCFIHPKYFENPASESGFDLAIIKCRWTKDDSRLMEHKVPGSLFGYHVVLANLVKECGVSVTGFPSEKHGQLWGMHGDIKLEKECITYTSIDTTLGQSGCPIYLEGDKNEQSPYIVGIHAGGNTCKNWGTRLTKGKIKWIRGMIEKDDSTYKVQVAVYNPPIQLKYNNWHATVDCRLHESDVGRSSLPRKVYERGNNKEKYMVKIYKITKDNPKLDENKFEMIGFPQDYSLKSMATDVCVVAVVILFVCSVYDKKNFISFFVFLFFIMQFENEIEEEDDEKGGNEGGNSDLPKVHLSARFEAIKAIYPLQKRITVTEDDIKDEDPKRFVEVPDDFLRTKLDDMNFADDKPEIIVEYLDQKENQWPLAKTDETWKDFKVGDIIDAIV